MPPTRQRRVPETPFQPGAPDRTFEFLGLLRFPLAALPLVLGELLRSWQQANSRRRPSGDEPFGPVFDLPVGPFSGLTGQFFSREVLSMADDDAFNFNRIPGFFSDTGWQLVGGTGILRIGRMVQVGSENTAGPADGSPDELQTGFTGQRWKLFTPEGEEAGEIGNGTRITKSVAQTGSYSLIGQRTVLGFRDLNGDPQPFPTEFPDPEPEPFTGPTGQPLRIAPLTAPLAPPEVAPPAPVPGREPVPDRTRSPDRSTDRRTLAPPVPRSGGSRTLAPPVPADAEALDLTGERRRQQAPPVVPTRTGSTFLPGGRELPSNGPRPTPPAIAAEMGKLEQKLEILLAPPEDQAPVELLERISEQLERLKAAVDACCSAEPYTFDAGVYQLFPVCEKDADGNPLAPREAFWEGGEGRFTELRHRLDALAQLIQLHKDTKQPVCGGRGNGPGSNVTVHFESD